MSSIENNQALNNILEKIGAKTPEADATKRKSSLGQEDFLRLMTTQLQNQDPFAPMENGEFIAQMAQFSTVTGITEMGQSLNGISDKLNEFRIATASDLLGNSVLVPGNIARPNKNNEIHGIIDLPSASSETSVSFFDDSGEHLHSIDLGAQPGGLVGFEWLDIPEDIKVKSIKEAQNEIKGIIHELEDKETSIQDSIDRYKRMMQLNEHIQDEFRKRAKEINKNSTEKTQKK